MQQSTNSVRQNAGSKKHRSHVRHASSSHVTKKPLLTQSTLSDDNQSPRMPTSLSPILRGQSLSHVIQKSGARNIIYPVGTSNSKRNTERSSSPDGPRFGGKETKPKKQDAPKLSARARLQHEQMNIQGHLRTTEDIINECTRAVVQTRERNSPSIMIDRENPVYQEVKNKILLQRNASMTFQAPNLDRGKKNSEGSLNFLDLKTPTPQGLNGQGLSKLNTAVTSSPEFQKMTSLVEKLQTRLNESYNGEPLLTSPRKDKSKSPVSEWKPKRGKNRLKEKGFDRFSLFYELVGETQNSNYKKLSKLRDSDSFKLVDSQFADTLLFQGISPQSRNELRLVTDRSIEKRRTTLPLNSERELSPALSPARDPKNTYGGDFKILNFLTPQNQQDFEVLQERDDAYEQLDPRAEDIFVDQPGVYFEMNPQNKKIEELKQFYEGAELALNPNPANTLQAKIERIKHNKFIKDYKYNEVPENITIGKKGILQPVFMQRNGSMCFTELWNNSERRKVAKTVVNEINCLRIANPEREGELLYRPAKWQREAELTKQIKERKQKGNYVPIKSVQNDKAHLREYAEPTLKYSNNVSPVSNRALGQVEVKQRNAYKTPEAASPVFTRSMSSPKFNRADSPISATKAMRESPTLFTKMLRAETRMSQQRLSQKIAKQNLKDLEHLSSASKLAV